MSRRLVNVPGIGHPDRYSGAAVYGDLIWTAGQVPAGEDGQVPEGIDAQVAQVLDNLERTLVAAGGGLDTLLKVQTFLTTLDHFDAYNRVYVERLSPHGMPPRTTVEIVRFPGTMLIEMDAVAHVR